MRNLSRYLRTLQALRLKAMTHLLERWRALPAEVRLAALLDCQPEQLPDPTTAWSEEDSAAWHRIRALGLPVPERELHAQLVQQFASEGLSPSWQAIFQRAGLLRTPPASSRRKRFRGENPGEGACSRL
jgi:hypothetical protein